MRAGGVRGRGLPRLPFCLQAVSVLRWFSLPHGSCLERRQAACSRLPSSSSAFLFSRRGDRAGKRLDGHFVRWPVAVCVCRDAQPKANLVVIAGLFAGLGALAREYGPLLSIGRICRACEPIARRAAICRCLLLYLRPSAAPWYIRIWALTGNPIYPMDTGLGLPVNPVLGGIRSTYHEFLGIAGYPITFWLQVAGRLMIGAPLALLLGLVGIFAAGRRTVGLAFSAILALGLWYASVANTAGGISFTWRFITPAWVAFSIVTGALGGLLVPTTDRWKLVLSKAAGAVFVVCGCYAMLSCWSEPSDPFAFFSAVASTRDDPLDLYKIQLWVAKKLEESNLPPTGILTEDCNFAVVLQRNTRFRPIMVWSPEAALVFDPNSEAIDVRQQLIDKGIWLVAVTYNSLNNIYLIRFPFFRDQFQYGTSILAIPDKISIDFLPKIVEPNPEAERKP